MPSLGDVLKQANAPAAPAAPPRAGLHQAFPKGQPGIRKSASLQRHEPFAAQGGLWAPRDYKSQSQAAYGENHESHVAERPTLSTELLQRSSIANSKDHGTDRAARTSTADWTYAETLRSNAGPKHRQMSGRGAAVTKDMRLTSRDLQFHAPIFRSNSEEDRFVTQTRDTYKAHGGGHRPPPRRTRRQFYTSDGVTSAIAPGEDGSRFVTEARDTYRAKDPSDVQHVVQAGDARRFSAFDRVKESSDAWE